MTLDTTDTILTHSTRTKTNPDVGYEKSIPQTEMMGCLAKSSVEVECLVSDGSCIEEPSITLG